jgi:hypothetical protein
MNRLVIRDCHDHQQPGDGERNGHGQMEGCRADSHEYEQDLLGSVRH